MAIDETAARPGANRLKLGLFSLNVERGGSISAAPGLLPLDWAHARELARAADEMGLEFVVPVGRWRGFGGATDFAGNCFDNLCFAAGLAEATERIGIMSTLHVPTIHPLVAAKQLTTIDHISGGRAALNVVGGWFRPELEMFGAPMLEHERRYELAAEWTTCLTHLWTSEEPLNFAGEFFSITDGVSRPKPLQDPRPAIMNAGGSARGRRFAAEHADMAFVLTHAEDESTARQVAEYRATARTEFGRDLELWTHVTVTCHEDEARARALEAEVLDAGDVGAVDNLLAAMGIHTAELCERERRNLRERFVTGWGSPQLTGTPEQVATRLTDLSRSGMDGILLSFPRYAEGLATLRHRVLPLLEQAGLRQPVPATERVA